MNNIHVIPNFISFFWALGIVRYLVCICKPMVHSVEEWMISHKIYKHSAQPLKHLVIQKRSDQRGPSDLQNAIFSWWKSDGWNHLNKMILCLLKALYLDRSILQIDPNRLTTQKMRGKIFNGLIILKR